MDVLKNDSTLWLGDAAQRARVYYLCLKYLFKLIQDQYKNNNFLKKTVKIKAIL